MTMIDWNTYRQQLIAGVNGVAKLSPDTVKGYRFIQPKLRRPARLRKNSQRCLVLRSA